MALEERDDDDALDESTSPWEFKIPLGLLLFGIALMAMHGFATSGAEGGGSVLLGIAIALLIYLPITIVAMFIAASILDITFGEIRPAILKIAGIFVFTAALQDVGSTFGHPILGWAVGLGASLVLYSKAFGLSAMEGISAVFVLGIVRFLLGLAIAALFVALKRG